MSIGIYMRVSKGRGQDTASQEPDLERWAAAQPEEVKVFIDHVTGKSMDRPGFSKLLNAARTGKVTTIVVWRLDRLGRTAKGLTSLFDELKALRVNLVSLKDGLELATPAGALMANVLASVAQYETEIRAERIRVGLAVAKANGVKLGRPKRVGDGQGKRIKVTTEQESIVIRLRSEDESVSAIARTTGLSRPTIYSILSQGADEHD